MRKHIFKIVINGSELLLELPSNLVSTADPSGKHSIFPPPDSNPQIE